MSGDGIPGLAEKLDHLFTTVPAPTKSGVYSNDSAAAALEDLGVTVSGVHLSHLRSGRRDNPSARLLAALADLFGVPYAYFFDSATEDKINTELDALAAIRDSRTKSIMMRVHSVSPQNMGFLEHVLEHLLEIKGQDSHGANPSDQPANQPDSRPNSRPSNQPSKRPGRKPGRKAAAKPGTEPGERAGA